MTRYLKLLSLAFVGLLPATMLAQSPASSTAKAKKAPFKGTVSITLNAQLNPELAKQWGREGSGYEGVKAGLRITADGQGKFAIDSINLFDGGEISSGKYNKIVVDTVAKTITTWDLARYNFVNEDVESSGTTTSEAEEVLLTQTTYTWNPSPAKSGKVLSKKDSASLLRECKKMIKQFMPNGVEDKGRGGLVGIQPSRKWHTDMSSPGTQAQMDWQCIEAGATINDILNIIQSFSLDNLGGFGAQVPIYIQELRKSMPAEFLNSSPSTVQFSASENMGSGKKAKPMLIVKGRIDMNYRSGVVDVTAFTAQYPIAKYITRVANEPYKPEGMPRTFGNEEPIREEIAIPAPPDPADK